MYISFVASPLMKYAVFPSLDEINGIFIPKFEYPLYARGIDKLGVFYANQTSMCLVLHLN